MREPLRGPFTWPGFVVLWIRKLAPTPITRSASSSANVNASGRELPPAPIDNGCVSGKLDLPSRVVPTGASMSSANSMRGGVASAYRTPCPAIITGRAEAMIRSTARSMLVGSPAGRDRGRTTYGLAVAPTGMRATKPGTSTATGPSRPICNRDRARRITAPISLGDRTRSTYFVTSRSRSAAYDDAGPFVVSSIPPGSNSTGTLSEDAVAMPAYAFSTPGPSCIANTPGGRPWETRLKPSAIPTLTRSCRLRIGRIPASAAAFINAFEG